MPLAIIKDLQGNYANPGGRSVPIGKGEIYSIYPWKNTFHGSVPDNFFINQNIPNPFRRSTAIHYGIPAMGKGLKTEIAIYDITGKKLRQFRNQSTDPGYYKLFWNPGVSNNLSNGLYICRFKSGGYLKQIKMLRIK
jgi:hypothetical protein